MTWFSNVLHFDVAHFDIIQQQVWLFVLKMLHPQTAEHTNGSGCVKLGFKSCEL